MIKSVKKKKKTSSISMIRLIYINVGEEVFWHAAITPLKVVDRICSLKM